MNDKTCKTCERTMDIGNFDEGLKPVKCASQVKEPVITNINMNEMRLKEKHIKKVRKIEKWSRTRIKHIDLKIVSCSVCNCSMTPAHYYKHQNTEEHQRTLNDGQQFGFSKNECGNGVFTVMIMKMKEV